MMDPQLGLAEWERVYSPQNSLCILLYNLSRFAVDFDSKALEWIEVRDMQGKEV